MNTVNKNSSWTEEEISILLLCEGMTQKEIAKLLPKKKLRAVSYMCEKLELKTWASVNPSNWSQKEISILKEHYSSTHIEELARLLPKRTKDSISTHARRQGLSKNKSYIDSKKPKDKNLLSETFKRYKESISTPTNDFYMSDDKNHLCVLFRHYLRNNNYTITRDLFTDEIIYGVVLEEANLKTMVKKHFSSYYSFICHCFPTYGFKVWEFKRLNVPNGHWNIDNNCFEIIEFSIGSMLLNKVISRRSDILSVSLETLGAYTNRTLVSQRGREVFYLYLKHKKISFSPEDFMWFDKVRFDSIEEMEVYKYIASTGLFIEKLCVKDLIRNPSNGEGYIPDFIINGKTLVEYYGLWGASGIFASYTEKATRKTQFYKDSGYDFIAIYPADLKKSYQGIKEKISRLL